MRTVGRRRALAAVLALSLAVAACGGSGATPDAESHEPTATPTDMSEITIGWAADIHGLDKSAVIGEQTIRLHEQIYAKLFEPAPEGRGLENGLAESHTVSDDRLTWTFLLREGLRFSDGTDLTAHDVVFSLEESRDQGGLLAFLYREFAHIQATDDRTVVIRTERPFAPMLAVLSERSAGIVPAGYGGRTRDAFYEAPVSSGPFVVERWDRGERVVLAANPHHHEPSDLERVTFEVVPDDNARVLKLRDGQLDAIWDVPFASLPELESDDGVHVLAAPWTLADLIMLNQAAGPLADPDVRRAILLGVDRASVVGSIMQGRAELASSFLTETLVERQEAGHATFDPDAARTALAASSYPDGFGFQLKYPGNDRTVTGVVQALQEQLSQLDVTVDLVPTEPAALSGAWVSGDFEALYMGVSSGIPDPDYLATAFVTSMGFFTGYVSEEATTLAAEAAATFDDHERQETYRRFLDLVMEDAPLLPLHEPSNLVAVRSELGELTTSLTGHFFLP